MADMFTRFDDEYCWLTYIWTEVAEQYEVGDSFFYPNFARRGEIIAISPGPTFASEQDKDVFKPTRSDRTSYLLLKFPATKDGRFLRLERTTSGDTP